MFGIGSNEIQAIFIMLVFCVFYIIPSLIAHSRKAKRLPGIIVLNLLLGWTLLGWVGALIWAVSDNTKDGN